MTPSEHISADRNQERASQPRASILMVDDHPSNLLALEAILEPLGQELVKATSGEEALKFLLQRDFAVILMDVQMPGLDGFQTATLIKQRERTRTIPIIFLTALSRDAAHVFKGYAHGAVDYLLKPFDPEILRSKVSVFVDLFLKEQQIQRQAVLLRQREREALERQSELRHLRLTESLPEVMWAARSDGSFTYANRAARDYTGIQAEQPLSLNTFLEFVHPVDREAMRAAWVQAIRMGQRVEREFRLRRFDGVYRWHLARAVPERDENGLLAGWIAVATDIDDKRRAEEALGRFKATLDATLDCVLMFSPDSLTLTYANAGAAKQLASSTDELVGLSVLEVEGAFDEAGFRKLLAPLVSGTLPSQTYSTSHRRRDGSEVPVEVVLQYVAADGGPGRFISVARDITERQRAETALRLASEAKDSFLAAASHELRTPLAAAKGHAHLALLKLGGETEAGPGKSLKIINRQIDRMAKLVEDLLDISRLQAGRLSLELERFDLSHLVHETRDRMAVLSQGHEIHVEASDQLEGTWDRGRLDQVLTNLLSNALRYSPEGGPVWVRVQGEHDEGVHLSVTDTGVGIPKEKQGLIFERFGRAHGSKYGGLGLGLTISQGIVEQHGGRIWVESPGVAGEGSTFHVWLPRETEAPTGGVHPDAATRSAN
ncbi:MULTISPECIES: hybrid sensor histidine kinase/response regulator [Myxococcus]|nr:MULTISPECIES: ATP-binding protein [Myxococcus]QPM79041.1 PAS domain S-box protein [Myxococcus xanthus]QVW68119.1 PAS domain S-box protein [Myxococcus xanthus DZ2]QZZ54347.1 Sensor histidine kinase RcsC [Myxococcus xanthus]UEO05767.1 PAS domain S-box protein [Myxococcus xanthus DZ2]UYI13989.1 PAS domain S-box protein [Myxococcus xanthus]